MKGLFLAIVTATLAYSGWWFYAAQSLRSDVEAWFDAQRAAGWQASYADISVRGFPSRTDLTLTDPVLRTPDGSYGWAAPFFQILALSYRRGHVIVAWPDTQTLMTPDGEVAVTSDGFRASVIHDGALIQRFNVEAETLNLTGPDRTIAMAGLNTALEKVDPSRASYRFAISIDGIAAPASPVTGSLVPESFATVRADTSLDLTDPLSLDGFGTDMPDLDMISFRNTQLTYGTLVLKAAGQADFDAQGRATGEITFEAANWRESLETAEANNHLPPGLSEGLLELLTLVASLSGSRDTLDVTLGFDRGTVLLGPLPIGRLPPLR